MLNWRERFCDDLIFNVKVLNNGLLIAKWVEIFLKYKSDSPDCSQLVTCQCGHGGGVHHTEVLPDHSLLDFLPNIGPIYWPGYGLQAFHWTWWKHHNHKLLVNNPLLEQNNNRIVLRYLFSKKRSLQWVNRWTTWEHKDGLFEGRR